MKLRSLVLIISLTSSLTCFAQATEKPAWVEPLFGPEFTFDRSESAGTAITSNLHDCCRAHLIENQPFGARFVFENEDGPGYYYSPNGWGFSLGHDSGVIEVTMNPETADTFKKFEADIQDAIFASASNVGLFPSLYLGGGHINISWETFADNFQLLRNFLVDLYNHAELTMGIFGYDTHNALPIQMVTQFHKQKFLELIEKIDKREIRTVVDFASTFNNPAFLSEFLFFQSWKERTTVNERPLRFFSLAFRHDIKPQLRHLDRFELRAVRPQASMSVFVRQVSLLRNRLRYLYNLDKNLQIESKVKIGPLDVSQHKLNPPVDPQSALKAFYAYVIESGEQWSDHRDYIWPAWIEAGELAKFEQGLNLCSDLL